MDLGFVLLTGAAVVAAVVLSVIVGTLTARLFFRATRGDARDVD